MSRVAFLFVVYGRLAQVSVIPFEDYTRPEGNTLKPGSRKSRRKEQYPPRALAAQSEADLVAA